VEIVREVGLRATMADGVELVSDAWYPSGDGSWPVLLQRLPYGRSVASTPVLPHPSWFARRGYAVVVQDCRGRGDSGGRFEPFVHEGDDGATSIEWAAAQPFSDGRVATYGFSYQGLGQLYVAAQRPPSLRAIAPMMCGPDPYDGWTYEGGLLRWPFVCFWAAQLAGQDVGTGPIPFDPTVLPRSAALGSEPPLWFVDWLAHPADDDYWQARRPDLEAIAASGIPVFTVLGWFDDFSSGTAALIDRLGARAWCGPWAHMPWGTTHGGVDFGPDASPAPVFEALVAFFDEVFGRRPAPTGERVHYFSVGGGWHSAASWPPLHQVRTYLGVSATGDANSRWGDGALLTESIEPGRPAVIVAEPLVPWPGDPIDYQDESAAQDRRDVACYTSAPLTEILAVAGSPVVRVVTRCDRPAHDLVAVLSVVDVDGVARALTASGRRLGSPGAPSTEHDWTITLRPIAFRAGVATRLRLTLSASRFPCFDRNPQTGAHEPDTPASDHAVATIEMISVRLELPVST
jgi:putative CocE/NonD family hydrolase